MCYHTSSKGTPAELKKAFDAPFAGEENYLPQFHANGFAHPKLPVFAKDEIRLLQWGLMPNWSGKSLQDMLRMAKGNLNARNDTIFEKPSFRDSIWNQDPAQIKRCVIPSSGIFEPHTHKGVKYPFYIYPQDQPFFFLAGIYSHWKDPKTKIWYSTYSIITTEPNRIARKIHNENDRMPVILHQQDIALWCDPNTPRAVLEDLMRPAPEEGISALPVSRDIFLSSVNSNRPDIFQHVAYPELAHDPELFHGFNI